MSDRYVDSSVAYQGGGRELGVQTVLDINRPATQMLMPLATVFLDVPHEASLARRLSASDPDRLEQEGSAFFGRIEAAYREMIARDSDRFLVVDATQSREAIAEKVASGVLERLMEAESHG